MKLLIAILPALILCGCHKAPDTKRVVLGEVKYQGKSIPFGRILLLPETGAQASPAGTFISDGKYRIDAKDGVTFGNYKVEIKGYPAKTNARSVGPADPDYVAGQGQLLPAIYNTESTLKLVVEPGSEPLVHDFELQ